VNAPLTTGWSQDGESWTDYHNDALVITTHIPSDSYVSLGKKNAACTAWRRVMFMRCSKFQYAISQLRWHSEIRSSEHQRQISGVFQQTVIDKVSQSQHQVVGSG